MERLQTIGLSEAELETIDILVLEGKVVSQNFNIFPVSEKGNNRLANALKKEISKHSVSTTIDATTEPTIEITVKNGRSSKTFRMIKPVMYDAIYERVQSSWEIFLVSDFELLTDDERTIITSTNCSHVCIGEKVTLSVSSLVTGFSDFTKERAIEYAELATLYETNESKFLDYDNIDESILTSEINFIYNDLNRKYKVYSNAVRSETTMREFISPFLVSAAMLVSDIQLYCERNIRGSRANGPIDYLAIYRSFIICVTEAKKVEIEKGYAQNIAQMKASREAFQFHEAAKQDNKNKRKYREIINEVNYRSELPSSGIVSTGEHWQFLRYEWDENEHHWKVFSSDIIELYLTDFNNLEMNSEIIKRKIKAILLKIAGVLKFQKDKCDAAPITKKNKIDEIPRY